MKHLKTLGLAAVAVAAMMAILGAGSASAAPTVLCKVAELPCASANRYPSNTKFTWETEGTSKLEGINSAGKTELTVECASKMTFENTAASGEPLPIRFTAFSFTGCNNSCSVSLQGLPYTGSLAWTSGSNGVLAIDNFSTILKCLFGFVECKVGAKEIKMTLDGGNPAKLLAVKFPMELEMVSGASTCPAKALWTVTYKATSPTAVFVSHT
jgi:hypothetical protein